MDRSCVPTLPDSPAVVKYVTGDDYKFEPLESSSPRYHTHYDPYYDLNIEEFVI